MPLILTNSTTLVLAPESGASAPVLTPWSARGLRVTLDVIGSGTDGSSATLRRDINGVLQDVSDERFRKYEMTVSCSDGETPCIDGAWTGVAVLVDCPFEFSYLTGSSPARPVVSGSSRTQGDFTYYRPQLSMRVAAIRDSSQEYAALHNWEIRLKEI